MAPLPSTTQGSHPSRKTIQKMATATPIFKPTFFANALCFGARDHFQSLHLALLLVLPGKMICLCASLTGCCGIRRF